MSTTSYGKNPNQSITLKFDFQQGLLGWSAGFADYAFNQADLRLESGLRNLPGEVGDGTGFYIQGNNRSDDLFMFLKRKLTNTDGIVALQAYQVNFKLAFASNAPTDCVGIGGAPGESVFLKAGATSIEPVPFLDSDNQLRMNVDKGNQSTGGPAASVVGNIANGIPCDRVPNLEDAPYVSLVKSHRHEFTVTASENAELWLLVGTDSGFEGLTALYYQQIDVELAPIDTNRS